MIKQPMLKDPKIRWHLYQLVASNVDNYGFFDPTEVTMQQLKYSGDLHLLNKQHAADSVLSYYSSLDALRHQQDDVTEFIKDLFKLQDQLFDNKTLVEIDQSQNLGIIPPAFDQPIKLREFLNKVESYKISKATYDQRVAGELRRAQKLLRFLQTTYHLKED